LYCQHFSFQPLTLIISLLIAIDWLCHFATIFATFSASRRRQPWYAFSFQPPLFAFSAITSLCQLFAAGFRCRQRWLSAAAYTAIRHASDFAMPLPSRYFADDTLSPYAISFRYALPFLSPYFRCFLSSLLLSLMPFSFMLATSCQPATVIRHTLPFSLFLLPFHTLGFRWLQPSGWFHHFLFFIATPLIRLPPCFSASQLLRRYFTAAIEPWLSAPAFEAFATLYAIAFRHCASRQTAITLRLLISFHSLQDDGWHWLRHYTHCTLIENSFHFSDISFSWW